MSDDRYWGRVCEAYRRQRAKGLRKYGETLEDNPAAMTARLSHIEEELVDALMYIEWAKDRLGGGA